MKVGQYFHPQDNLTYLSHKSNVDGEQGCDNIKSGSSISSSSLEPDHLTKKRRRSSDGRSSDDIELGNKTPDADVRGFIIMILCLREYVFIQ